jgi:hypothetical protein
MYRPSGELALPRTEDTCTSYQGLFAKQIPVVRRVFRKGRVVDMPPNMQMFIAFHADRIYCAESHCFSSFAVGS